MLMSQGAISAGAIGWPNFGACADTVAVKAMMAAPAARYLSVDLSVDIGGLPLVVDAPAVDGIEGILPARAALGDEGRARRLHHAGVVSGAVLQYGWPAVPLPRRTEAHGSLRQDRSRQGRGCPALATVGRDLDLTNAAVARPG